MQNQNRTSNKGHFYKPTALEKIKKLLDSKLISPNKPSIDEIYQHLEDYDNNHDVNALSFCHIKDLQEPYKSYLQSFDGNIVTIAIDFPIFLKSETENAETVMVCAMDSLPPTPEELKKRHEERGIDFDMNNNIGYWAPFSLIDDWNKKEKSMNNNIPFFEEILKHYNIYVTDIYKVFFRKPKQGGYTLSNEIPDYTNLSINGKNIHGEIMRKEIEIIQPKAIITLGNASRDRLLEENKSITSITQKASKWGEELQIFKWGDDIKIISSPHISSSANGTKKTIINAHKKSVINKDKDKKTLHNNQLLARIVCNNI